MLRLTHFKAWVWPRSLPLSTPPVRLVTAGLTTGGARLVVDPEEARGVVA
jgi:hypothetical protein